MRSDLTYVAVVLDRSGSMRNVTEDTIGGFNAFLDEQQRLPGDVLFTLVQFADYPRVVADAIPIGKAQPLNHDTYQATGSSTSLYDAIGFTIESVGQKLAAMRESERPARVLVMIQTDGQENSSCTYTRGRVAEMIKHQREKYSWDFVFIGASEQAVADAVAMGVQHDWAAQYAATPDGTARMLRGASASVGRYRHEVASNNGVIGTTFNFFEP